MSTLNEILQSVRDELGEDGNGYWKDEELVRWAQLAFTRHAREALSVPAEVKTTTLPGVQEYELPADFGELIDVRFHDQHSTKPEPLIYVDKQTLLTAHGSIFYIGEPSECYIYQDKIGLYPVPDKSPFYERTFSGDGTLFTNILTAEAQAFENQFELDLEDVSEPRIEISHIGVLLKREGYPYPGDIQMWMTPETAEGASVSEWTLKSNPIPALFVNVEPEWVLFDFTNAPVTLLPNAVTWKMGIQTDADYRNADASTYQGPGVQIGIDTTGEAGTAWLQLHCMKNDLEIDYYRNTCPPILNYDEELELPYYPPARYHPTIIDMVLAKAMRKGQYNLAAANDYEGRSKRDIMYARAQATLKTRGDIQRVPKRVRVSNRRGPYVDYRNGRFTGRAF